MTSQQETDYLQWLAAEPVDDETKASIEEAQAQYERGEFVTLEQSNINLQKFIAAWERAEAEIHA